MHLCQEVQSVIVTWSAVLRSAVLRVLCLAPAAFAAGLAPARPLGDHPPDAELRVDPLSVVGVLAGAAAFLGEGIMVRGDAAPLAPVLLLPAGICTARGAAPLVPVLPLAEDV